ncbi:MAG: NAD(P)H-hydrate dehydratase [Magnetovibrionaceae bacterium]
MADMNIPDSRNELLLIDEMYEADRLAIKGGVPGVELMENAGRTIAEAIKERWSRRALLVLAGPGNNGGDGFVVARLLSEDGWPVRIGLLGIRERLRGDAAIMADRWEAIGGRTETLSAGLLDGAELVVDALFGAGLGRDLDGTAKTVVEALAASVLPVVAVDVPSGVDGESGVIRGAAARADLTVTFFRAKPGHWLYPGRGLIGDLMVTDIGIPETVLETLSPLTALNTPAAWKPRFPVPGPEDHKYTRGHVLVGVGRIMTGAARLAARAARRAGAGLLTLAAPAGTEQVCQLDQAGAIVQPCDDAETFVRLLSDNRRNAVLLGPGLGIGPNTRADVSAALSCPDKTLLLDADALSAYEGSTHQSEKEAFLARVKGHGKVILTPHDGEFARLFGDLPGSRLARARQAARLSGAVVILKGADSVIAEPGGRALINHNAPAWLATGGSGDTLAGLVIGLAAQGMPPFEAAAAGVWLLSETARNIGPGLIAEDLADRLPPVLNKLIGP